MKIYLAQKGDTLEEIAKNLNIDIQKLLSMNPNLRLSDSLKVGSKVVLVKSGDSPAPPEDDAMQTYVVKQGDTLWKLSKQWGLSLQDLIILNPQLKNPNVLMTNETIYVPQFVFLNGNPNDEEEKCVAPVSEIHAKCYPEADVDSLGNTTDVKDQVPVVLVTDDMSDVNHLNPSIVFPMEPDEHPEMKTCLNYSSNGSDPYSSSYSNTYSDPNGSSSYSSDPYSSSNVIDTYSGNCVAPYMWNHVMYMPNISSTMISAIGPYPGEIGIPPFAYGEEAYASPCIHSNVQTAHQTNPYTCTCNDNPSLSSMTYQSTAPFLSLATLSAQGVHLNTPYTNLLQSELASLTSNLAHAYKQEELESNGNEQLHTQPYMFEYTQPAYAPTWKTPPTTHESPKESCESPKESCELPKESCESPKESCESPKESCESPKESCESTKESCESTKSTNELLSTTCVSPPPTYKAPALPRALHTSQLDNQLEDKQEHKKQKRYPHHKPNHKQIPFPKLRTKSKTNPQMPWS